MSDAYLRQREFFQNISGSLSVATATDDTTLVTNGRSSDTIFIQKIHVQVTAVSSSKTWTFKDSAGTPVLTAAAIDAGTLGHTDMDFGADGVPLTEGKNFLLDVSAAGAAGQITWEGYQKLTGATSA